MHAHLIFFCRVFHQQSPHRSTSYVCNLDALIPILGWSIPRRPVALLWTSRCWIERGLGLVSLLLQGARIPKRRRVQMQSRLVGKRTHRIPRRCAQWYHHNVFPPALDLYPCKRLHSQEYKALKKYGDSLLTRSSKLGDLASQLDEAVQGTNSSPHAERVRKYETWYLSFCCGLCVCMSAPWIHHVRNNWAGSFSGAKRTCPVPSRSWRMSMIRLRG